MKKKEKENKNEKEKEKEEEQAHAGNSMRHLRDIRRSVTDGRTDGQTLP